jgi:hypothetical protein
MISEPAQVLCTSIDLLKRHTILSWNHNSPARPFSAAFAACIFLDSLLKRQKALLSQFTDDAVIHGVLGSAPIQQVEPVWRELHEGMAMVLSPQDAVVGNAAVISYVERGCFRGSFRAWPATPLRTVHTK